MARTRSVLLSAHSCSFLIISYLNLLMDLHFICELFSPSSWWPEIGVDEIGCSLVAFTNTTHNFLVDWLNK